MEELDFEFYERPNGHIEFQEFLDKLNKKDRVKLLAVIHAVSIYGIDVGIQQNWVKYMITHGFTKKTQKTPTREIEHAKKLRDEYFANKWR